MIKVKDDGSVPYRVIRQVMGEYGNEGLGKRILDSIIIDYDLIYMQFRNKISTDDILQNIIDILNKNRKIPRDYIRVISLVLILLHRHLRRSNDSL